MELVVEMWKNARLQMQGSFSHDSNNRIGLLVIDNWKNALLQSRAHFPTYQQPDDDKFFIYEMK